MPRQLYQNKIAPGQLMVETRCIASLRSPVQTRCIASLRSPVQTRCIASLRSPVQTRRIASLRSPIQTRCIASLLLIFLSALISFQGYANALDGKMGLKYDQTPDGKMEIKYDHTQDLQIPQFSKQTIDSFKQDRAFDYSENPEESWWTSFKNWLWELWGKFWNWVLGDYQANGFVSFLVYVLPYVIIAGIVGFIVWLFYKLNPGASLFGSKGNPEMFFSEEEEIIRNKNISELIDEALSNKNYRLAVRYYYLLILQNMMEAGIINYESDKTNSEYLSEIDSETLKSGFQKATNLYDHVWYGNFEVTAADFSKAQPTFTSLKTEISNSIG